MQGIILAAGKGTRLKPITLTRSKAMAPVVGKPIVARVMETFIKNGIYEFILVISEDDQEIRNYFRSDANLRSLGQNVSVEFVVQPERLGMANALSLAAPLIRDKFILSACDNLTPTTHVAELLATYHLHGANATLSLMEVERSRIKSMGIVDIQDGEIRRIVEKPDPEEAPSNIGSLPLYVFSPRILDYLPEVKPSLRGEYELQDAIQMLIERDGRVTGTFAKQRLQLTNADDLLALNRHYLINGNGSSRFAAQSIGQHTRLVTPACIEAGATIGAGCEIGPHVYIESGCQIGANVKIQNAMILRNSIVEDGRQVIGEVVA